MGAAASASSLPVAAHVESHYAASHHLSTNVTLQPRNGHLARTTAIARLQSVQRAKENQGCTRHPKINYSHVKSKVGETFRENCIRLPSRSAVSALVAEDQREEEEEEAEDEEEEVESWRVGLDLDSPQIPSPEWSSATSPLAASCTWRPLAQPSPSKRAQPKQAQPIISRRQPNLATDNETTNMEPWEGFVEGIDFANDSEPLPEEWRKLFGKQFREEKYERKLFLSQEVTNRLYRHEVDEDDLSDCSTEMRSTCIPQPLKPPISVLLRRGVTFDIRAPNAREVLGIPQEYGHRVGDVPLLFRRVVSHSVGSGQRPPSRQEEVRARHKDILQERKANIVQKMVTRDKLRELAATLQKDCKKNELLAMRAVLWAEIIYTVAFRSAWLMGRRQRAAAVFASFCLPILRRRVYTRKREVGRKFLAALCRARIPKVTPEWLRTTGPLFAKWPERNLSALCRRLRPCAFLRGQPIFMEGDPSEWLYFVVHGRVRTHVRRPDNSTKSRNVSSTQTVVTGPAYFGIPPPGI